MKTLSEILSAILLVALVAAPAFAQSGPATDPARFARGARSWADHCERCHNLRDVKDLPDFEWEVVVTHMQIRANLPGQMAEDIKAFLKGSN